MIDIHWEEVTVNETVVFSDDDLVLASVPIEAVRCAAITLTELVEHVPTARITLNPNETYSLMLSYWKGDSKIGVALFHADSTAPLYTWNLEDIDPF